jgi:hypothetical protein
MEIISETKNNDSLSNGLVIAIITSVIGIIVYYVAPSMMGSTVFGIGLGLLTLVIYILFTLDLRKKRGGYWTFREALKEIFLMAFIAGIVGILINLFFYKLIEPDAYSKISGYVVDGMVSSYEKMGMSQEQIDSIVPEMERSLKSQFDPSALDLAKNLGIAILIEFIMSLVFAAIFKKNPPIFVADEDE